MTAYKNGDQLGECLESLSAQTYQSREIVVVFDSSSDDNTGSVVDSFASSGTGRKVVRCERVGRSRARNLGWQSTQSEVIMFVDGDDKYEPEYLAKAINSLDSNAAAGGVCVGGTASPSKNPILRRYYRAFGGTDTRFKQSGQADPGWAWVYRRKCLEEVKGFDETLAQAEDRDLCSRVKQAGHTISYVGGVNWYHRKPESLSGLIRKECAGGRRRVVFEAKRRSVRSVLTHLVPAIYLFVIAASIPLAGLAAAALIALVGAVAFLAVSVSRHRGYSNSVVDALVSAPVALAVRLAFSFGVVYGLVVLSLTRAGVSHPDLGRF